jgi:GNAT superfamily N-acetyltransferase
MTRPASPAVVLRPSALGDIDDMIRIIQAIWVDTYDELTGRRLPAHRLLQFLAEARFTFIAGIGSTTTVACRDGRLVGWSWRERAFVEDLWVDPPEQGRGVGKLLLDHALSRMRSDGYRVATLDCIALNHRARRFYEREGWRPALYYVRTIWPGAQAAFMRYEHDL